MLYLEVNQPRVPRAFCCFILARRRGGAQGEVAHCRSLFAATVAWLKATFACAGARRACAEIVPFGERAGDRCCKGNCWERIRLALVRDPSFFALLCYRVVLSTLQRGGEFGLDQLRAALDWKPPSPSGCPLRISVLRPSRCRPRSLSGALCPGTSRRQLTSLRQVNPRPGSLLARDTSADSHHGECSRRS